MTQRKYQLVTVTVAALICTLSPASQAQQHPQGNQHQVDKTYETAVSEFNAGHFSEAAKHLEVIEPLLRDHFEVEELLGLVYAFLLQDVKAVPHLEAAVNLQPESEPARTNLARSLSNLGQRGEAERQFRKAVALAPEDYTANHNLGEFLLQASRLADGIPWLAHAQSIRPDASDNGFDLATAYLMTKQYADAKSLVQRLLRSQESGELHNLAGQIDEKEQKFVEAANEFETAAHLEPSESNLFDWGSELLLHRTYEPAIDVFRAGAKRYPASARLAIGLGMALYSRGLYEEALKVLLSAADLSPSDPRCYLFLSKAYDSSPSQADEVIQRFRRYAELAPENALAQYYYAVSLWKGKRSDGSGPGRERIEALLRRSIQLDPNLAEPHKVLGNIYADQHEYARSVPEYERALALDPDLPDAHYRLGTDYTHLGQKDRAEAEFEIYKKLRAEHLAEIDKERAEVRQFVYSSKTDQISKP